MAKIGDAMPGFGIVAAVLGVVITMGSIGGAATEIGEKVAAALVGTFLGILLSYGLVNPLANALEARLRAEHDYMSCIRTALLVVRARRLADDLRRVRAAQHRAGRAPDVRRARSADAQRRRSMAKGGTTNHHRQEERSRRTAATTAARGRSRTPTS